jgi:hypothetical protein
MIVNDGAGLNIGQKLQCCRLILLQKKLPVSKILKSILTVTVVCVES